MRFKRRIGDKELKSFKHEIDMKLHKMTFEELNETAKANAIYNFKELTEDWAIYKKMSKYSFWMGLANLLKNQIIVGHKVYIGKDEINKEGSCPIEKHRKREIQRPKNLAKYYKIRAMSI